jgi:hypothetical protein
MANAHEVAQAEAPERRVVCVDRDPVAVAHSELILADNNRTSILQADMRAAARLNRAGGDRTTELVEPGLVGFAEWRPEGPGDVSDDPEMNKVAYAGIGRKP